MAVIHVTGAEKQDLTATVEVHSVVGSPSLEVKSGFYADEDDQASTGASSTSVTLTKPANLRNGDVLCIFLHKESDSTVTWPTGFNVLSSEVDNNVSGKNFHEYFAYKIITDASSEPASYAPSWSPATWREAAIFRVSGVDTSTPINAEASAASTGQDTTSEPVSITPSVDNCLIVHCYGRFDSGTWLPETGYEEKLDNSSAIGVSIKKQTTAGAESNIVADSSVSSSNGAIIVAFNPKTNAVVRSGAASYKFAASGSEVSARIESNETSDDFVRQYAIYMPTGGLPASLTKIIQLSDGAGDHTSVRINSNGTLELWDDSGAVQLGSDTPAITLDAWNVIELDVGTTHGGNDAKMKLNGVMVAEGATHTAGANHRYSEIGIMGSVTATIYFDDCVIGTHSGGADFESWFNGIKLVMAKPNAAGDNAATAGTFASIDDNDDADYIQIDGAETPEYNYQSSSDIGLPSTALIGFVAVGARVRGETSTSCSWLPRIKSQASGTTVTGTTTTIASASFNTHDDTAGATRIYKLVSYTDPQGGGSWTPPKVDSMQIGASAPDAAPDVWISQMWAYIGYWEKTDSMVFRDQFATSSNIDLQSKTPDVGTSWTRLWGTTAGSDVLAMAATDRASPEAELNGGVMYTADVTYPSADYAIEAELCILDLATTTPQYLLVRVQDQENMYAVRLNEQGGTSTCQLYKKVSGTWSTLGSAFSPPYDGAIVKLQIIGSALKFYIDGVVVASATDTAITAAGKAGFAAGGGAELVASGDDMDVDNDLDNFTVFNLGSAVSTEVIQKSLKYTVKQPEAVTKSLKYTVKKAVGVTKSLKYTVKQPESITKSLKYTVKQAESVTKSLKYCVKTDTDITKSLQYVVVAVTENVIQKSLKYTVLTEVPVTKSLKYTVKDSVTVQKSLKYTIFVPGNAITKSLAYYVRIVYPITKSLKYVVEAPKQVTKSLKYTIHSTPSATTKSLKYTIRKALSVTKSLKYVVKQPESITKSLKYTVKTEQSVTKSLAYIVVVRVSIQKSLKYVVEAPQSVQKSLKYTVKTTPSATTKSLTYAVRVEAPITKSLTYLVKQPEAVTKSLQYTVKSAQSVTKSLQYVVESTQEVVIEKSLKYTVVTEQSVTKSLKYTLTTEAAIQKGLIYKVRKAVGISKNLLYELDTKNFTRGDENVLPTNNNDLETAYSNQEYSDVFSSDDIRVGQTAVAQYALHQFKSENDNNTDAIVIEVELQTDHTPSVSPVYLQIYNHDTTSWDTVDFNDSANPDEDFVLSADIREDVEKYYDIDNIVSVRVQQEGIE